MNTKDWNNQLMEYEDWKAEHENNESEVTENDSTGSKKYIK